MLFLLGRNNDSNKNNEVKENIASKSEENLNVNNIEEDNNGCLLYTSQPFSAILPFQYSLFAHEELPFCLYSLYVFL